MFTHNTKNWTIVNIVNTRQPAASISSRPQTWLEVRNFSPRPRSPAGSRLMTDLQTKYRVSLFSGAMFKGLHNKNCMIWIYWLYLLQKHSASKCNAIVVICKQIQDAKLTYAVAAIGNSKGNSVYILQAFWKEKERHTYSLTMFCIKKLRNILVQINHGLSCLMLMWANEGVRCEV